MGLHRGYDVVPLANPKNVKAFLDAHKPISSKDLDNLLFHTGRSLGIEGVLSPEEVEGAGQDNPEKFRDFKINMKRFVFLRRVRENEIRDKIQALALPLAIVSESHARGLFADLSGTHHISLSPQLVDAEPPELDMSVEEIKRADKAIKRLEQKYKTKP